ncbi:L,D-transpeptidase family protein [Halochromatium salexigens]|uniref:L,D-transpeptidase family protein n=1 Tax=Halochromatium salexigens TaxID=49447 RepID=UPI003B83460E
MPPGSPSLLRIEIDLELQRLSLYRGETLVEAVSVSTAARGPGELNGSGCTPRGLHRIRLKVGQGCPSGAVFRARRWTGEIYSDALAAATPQRDWILSRILWLTGCEPGRNRGGAVDTLRRFVYIHGCPETEPMGVPRSRGCIRMRNADVIRLCDLVPVGCPVLIG